MQQYLSYTRSKKTKAPRLTRHSRGVWGNPPPVQMISLSLSLCPLSPVPSPYLCGSPMCVASVTIQKNRVLQRNDRAVYRGVVAELSGDRRCNVLTRCNGVVLRTIQSPRYSSFIATVLRSVARRRVGQRVQQKKVSALRRLSCKAGLRMMTLLFCTTIRSTNYAYSAAAS